MTEGGGSAEGLSVLHQRLETHFETLRTHRDRVAGPEVPIFALEHGLTDADVRLLMTTVRAAVQRRQRPGAAWLPFIIYSAEIGYEYSGDEYWQTFTSRTPGWAEIGDRDYIRSNFYKFAKQFGGARPSGAWADHFSIICWPITHAVLPTDLQRQLVQLLFDYRTALTSDLLADPAELGSRLAARTWPFSSRFQNFAQNSGLLGQVAAALLVLDDEESPFLLDSTLKRIVETLSAHREARMWLRDAQSSASRVRTRGFRTPERPTQIRSTLGDRPRLPAATDPGVFLQLSEQGWSVHLYLPDLSGLAERLPILHDHLGRLRVRVAGTSAAPLARRRLLVSGQQIRLDQWPDRQLPLLQIEGDEQEIEAANRLLADQCVLSPGPIWLFRLRDPGLAVEVRGKFIRPGHSYILLASPGGLDSQRPSWITASASATAGVTAYNVQVPSVLSDLDIEAGRSIGLSVVADVGVRPAGIVPGRWDGEGAAEWLAGEDVVLAISSNRAVGKCALSVDEDPTFLDWPDTDSEIFVALSGLDIGTHNVRVALIPEEVDRPVAEGTLLVSVRATQSRPSTGTLREGLVLVANPARPTLSELWDGRATVELLGPLGTEVAITATLESARGAVLAQTRFKIRIPVDSVEWLKATSREMRGASALYDRYNESDVLVLTASHPGLGTALLRCEREFTPLRWIVGSDREGPYARLINNTEGSSIEVTRYEFSSPATAVPLPPNSEAPYRWAAGGLLRARINNFESSVILPPFVRDLADLRVLSHVTDGARTCDHVLSLVGLSALWRSASLSGDPFAHHDRRTALRALTSRIVSIPAGTRWAQLEERGARDDQFSFQQLQDTVGDDTYQKALAAAIRRRLLSWQALEPAKRAEEFAAVLSTFKHRTLVDHAEWHFAEFLLRLASEPATIMEWPESAIRTALDRTLVSPVLLRAARFVVLAVHLDESEDSGSTYRGWSWK
jgi:hypothetical protein